MDNFFSGLKFKHALNYVRMQTGNEAMVKKSGSRRTPAENYRILYRFLTRLGDESEVLLNMPYRAFEEMFRYRSLGDLANVVAAISERRKQLEALEQSIARVSALKRTDVSPPKDRMVQSLN